VRYEALFVAGVGSYLPKTVDVDDAVAMGHYDQEEQDSSGQLSVTVAGPDDTTPDMAVRAGRVALARSGRPARDVGLLLHAVTGYNGLDGWNAASYVQENVLDGAGVAFEVRQLSNGALAAVELAACHLAVAAGEAAVMITAADQFPLPSWDRWRSGWGLVFADGAGSLVLSRTGGFARVLAMTTVADSSLEVLHRGTAPFGAAPDPAAYPVDLRARSLDASLVIDFDEVGKRIESGMRKAAGTVAADLGIDVTEFDHYVVPHFGRELLRRECADVLRIDLDRTTHGWAMRVGHLGAADQLAGLAYLTESGRLARGDRVLMIGVGGGLNWTCLALQITNAPQWGR